MCAALLQTDAFETENLKKLENILKLRTSTLHGIVARTSRFACSRSSALKIDKFIDNLFQFDTVLRQVGNTVTACTPVRL